MAGFGSTTPARPPAPGWEDPKLPDIRLIWIMENGKPRQQVRPKGNIWSSQHEFHFSEKNIQAEQAILVSALRRLQGR